MSKKNKHLAPERSSLSNAEHGHEYRTIKHDLIKVVALNVVYLGLILAVYFTNNKSHYLERILGTWIS